MESTHLVELKETRLFAFVKRAGLTIPKRFPPVASTSTNVTNQSARAENAGPMLFASTRPEAFLDTAHRATQAIPTPIAMVIKV